MRFNSTDDLPRMQLIFVFEKYHNSFNSVFAKLDIENSDCNILNCIISFVLCRNEIFPEITLLVFKTNRIIRFINFWCYLLSNSRKQKSLAHFTYFVSTIF